MENNGDNQNGVNTDEQQEKKPLDVLEVIDLLKEVLKEVKINEAIDSFNNLKIEKIKSEETKALENLKSQGSANDINLTFWKAKFIKEFCVILVLLFAICYLSYIEKIDNCTLGTLLGSIIGYSIGNFSSSNNNHN